MRIYKRLHKNFYLKNKSMTTKVTFQLSPNIVLSATEGILLGDFNNWDINNGIKLKKQQKIGIGPQRQF